MLMIKRLMNQAREYWYTGSILARSAIQKNSTFGEGGSGGERRSKLLVHCVFGSSLVLWTQTLMVFA